MDDNALLTFVDAGRVAGVSHTTIRNWTHDPDNPLPTVRMPQSDRRRIRYKVLIAWLDGLDEGEVVKAR